MTTKTLTLAPGDAPPSAHPAPIALTVDARGPGRPLAHHWSVAVGAGRAHEGLRADFQDDLRLVVQHCGFRSLRFHGLFHDDMFVYREDELGHPHFNFIYVDLLFDRLLEIGVRPFVELGFSPRELARETETIFWWGGHGSPPKDLGKWHELIVATVTHWVQRYGVEEVARWHFEVWNEPNLDPFFRGTRSEYFELYRVTALAVKSVDPRLRIGGPATSNFVPDARFAGEREDISLHTVVGADELDRLSFTPVWVEEFLAYARRHDLPVDFVSCHPYPTDWALDEHGRSAKLTRHVDATPQDLALLRRLVHAGPFPDAELHLTEWSSSSSSRDHAHDQVPAATYVARSMVESIGSVASLAYWTLTDVFEEQGAGDELFHGGFGLIAYHGIPKPTFHAMRMLHRLGSTEVARGDSIVATRVAEPGAPPRLALLAYHYPAEVPRSVPASFDTRAVADATAAAGTPRLLTVDLHHLSPGATFDLEVLDGRHGNALAAWRAAGSPAEPTRDDLAAIRDAAWATRWTTYHASSTGTLRIVEELAPWSVVSLCERPTTNRPEDRP